MLDFFDAFRLGILEEAELERRVDRGRDEATPASLDHCRGGHGNGEPMDLGAAAPRPAANRLRGEVKPDRAGCISPGHLQHAL